MKKNRLWILGSIVMVLVGVFVVPKLLKCYTGKLYKNSHKEIDYEEFGPKIVKKNTKRGNENGN